MKSVSDLAREICDEFGLHIGMHTKRLQDFINNDRSSTLKRCAEVVRSKMIRGDYKDCPAGWMNNAYTIFAKAIEEMELK